MFFSLRRDNTYSCVKIWNKEEFNCLILFWQQGCALKNWDLVLTDHIICFEITQLDSLLQEVFIIKSRYSFSIFRCRSDKHSCCTVAAQNLAHNNNLFPRSFTKVELLSLSICMTSFLLFLSTGPSLYSLIHFYKRCVLYHKFCLIHFSTVFLHVKMWNFTKNIDIALLQQAQTLAHNKKFVTRSFPKSCIVIFIYLYN